MWPMCQVDAHSALGAWTICPSGVLNDFAGGGDFWTGSVDADGNKKGEDCDKWFPLPLHVWALVLGGSKGNPHLPTSSS